MTDFLAKFQQCIEQLDGRDIARVGGELLNLRQRGGRLFILGVGGSAANASHAVNDFRKLASIEAYAPTDNVAELTARTNDEGWASVFQEWLTVSRLTPDDAVLVLSVGGGSAQTSSNLIAALRYAGDVGATILGVVGRDGGFTRMVATACVVVPVIDANTVTPFTESMQSVLLHLWTCELVAAQRERQVA